MLSWIVRCVSTHLGRVILIVWQDMPTQAMYEIQDVYACVCAYSVSFLIREPLDIFKLKIKMQRYLNIHLFNFVSI